MTEIQTPESLHDYDWLKCKPDDKLLADSCRYKALLNLIKKHDPNTVFDIGCGSGVLGKMVSSWKPGITIHGCDISDRALDRARKILQRVWKVDLDKEDIPVESEYYDVVVCSDVLEHIYDVSHALREVNRLLKADGIALLTVPNLVYWRYRWDIILGDLPIPVNDDRHLHQFNQKSFTSKVHDADMITLSVLGCRVRYPWLADWKPSIFSDTLIFEVMKTGS